MTEPKFFRRHHDFYDISWEARTQPYPWTETDIETLFDETVSRHFTAERVLEILETGCHFFTKTAEYKMEQSTKGDLK